MSAGRSSNTICYRVSPPRRARWLLGGNTPLDFSRHTEPRKLTAEFAEWGLSDADVTDIEQVSDFIVFGMWNFCEGGGARPALVVRQRDGKVFSVDVEADDPVVLLNSSLEAFIDTSVCRTNILGMVSQSLPI